jgi:hypothetical protein
LKGNLGSVDLLLIHGDQRKTSNYQQVFHRTSSDLIYRYMVFGFLSASLKVRHGQATLPSSGECSTLPQDYHILLTLQFSQWYLPHEMALRMSLYNIAQPVGAMLSGVMQGALSTNLEGVLGRTGWRWAFIINVSRLSIFPNIWSSC